jgi:hypothetical protein
MANSDLNEIYLRDIMAGSEQEKGIHEEVALKPFYLLT